MIEVELRIIAPTHNLDQTQLAISSLQNTQTHPATSSPPNAQRQLEYTFSNLDGTCNDMHKIIEGAFEDSDNNQLIQCKWRYYSKFQLISFSL